MYKKYYDFFNYSSLIIVFILLVLMLTRSVPTGWFIYFVSFGILLLIVRIILRIYIAIKYSNQKKE
ncbi:MAG: hypothetical protein A2057_15485 [Ignavibacteria bacterium GWA2_35_9]|nr:MAG: hypothetical protein A2057_15485 [Ignavibacteria bacterium GWA2_35_9]OGU47851.1 MAG: hypothetical protein A2000_06065 [Ignavibacteria bacterium GWB2_36_8]OGU51458.1 MAG: hypothetical protein A2080_11130 [Ignavibacteria bacterium GWC2_36_12]